MGILKPVILALLYLCAVALAYYLTIWVLASLGIALPAMVLVILKVMFVLIAILVLARLFLPLVGGINWWGNP